MLHSAIRCEGGGNRDQNTDLVCKPMLRSCHLSDEAYLVFSPYTSSYTSHDSGSRDILNLEKMGESSDGVNETALRVQFSNESVLLFSKWFAPCSDLVCKPMI